MYHNNSSALYQPVVPNGPLGVQITNKQFIFYLTKSINFSYDIKALDNFPAPLPVSIEKKNFEKLEKFEYNVSLKLDGTRFLMYFLKDKLGKNQCILINRALKFFSIEINCDDNLYCGTLLDGELINVNLPFISVPLPSSADNHQLKNALYYEKKNFSYLIEEKDLDNKLFNLIKSINEDKFLIEKIRINQSQYSDKNVFNNINKQVKKIFDEKN